jgi:uncharacterized membrane protein YdjX (TVP38/TMEM64 family)
MVEARREAPAREAPAREAPALPASPMRGRWRRLVPLLLLAAAALLVVGMGWHRHLSLEALVRHRAEVEGFVATHPATALSVFAATYVMAVALSLPGAVFLTIAGGLLFGTLVGGLTAIVAATLGATLVFLIARSAAGELLARRAGAVAARLADGFRRDAFHYLLFLRLVPVFPFWIVNLVAALCGVRLQSFIAATALGIIPGTLAFAFLGAGLDSAVAVKMAELRACVAAGRTQCPLELGIGDLLTVELMAAFVVLGIVSLIPVIVRRLKLMPEQHSA